MQIYTIPVTPFGQNARVIVDESTQIAAIVDPGGDVNQILDAVQKLSVTVEKVILTHAHLDHAGGVRLLLSNLAQIQPGVTKLLGHRAEATMRAHLVQQAMMFGLSPNEYENCPEPDCYIDEGDTVSVGRWESEVRFTPGHSPGHVVLYFKADSVLIAGDTLFQGSIGRTDLPGGSHSQLIESIRTRIYSLPDETAVLCGHGPDTSVGLEKRTNPFVREENV